MRYACALLLILLSVSASAQDQDHQVSGQLSQIVTTCAPGVTCVLLDAATGEPMVLSQDADCRTFPDGETRCQYADGRLEITHEKPKPSAPWWFLAQNINDRDKAPRAFGPYPSKSFCMIAGNKLMPLNERFWDEGTRRRNEEHIARYGALTTGPVFHVALTICVQIPTDGR